ncbi:transcription termination/antitermination protein NusG [Candidatus Roizmanbacteria bacterium CG10_big_fil_rev_8_21_14_0_10_39_6]|uniref:Transcription termination/antitermination protein NusG n=1 Tax=Candidatus Roizmanbacteria bacterium CG10_big_fil_rev_8_21_14_0_10_39_6 TaxID=1974853 RepID=A0A2M8KRZ4_9BACT|nr:MAG: transcription termination/antitermination protein NusG [Candidatus Roizmanbacteria bacterium CG10_big_fil_rev_8_21_14_0_10_39_6]
MDQTDTAVTTTTDTSQEVVSKETHPDAKWYVVHTQAGYEQRTKIALEERVKTLGYAHQIFETIVPMRNVITIKQGKKKQIKEKLFPGYLLVSMILNDDSRLVVRTTEGVTGFVGAGNKPTPISEKEVAAILKFTTQQTPKFKTKFSVSEAVKIVDGPFSDFLGTIQKVDSEQGKVKVLISIFGRETPVELDFLQVEKI